MPLKAQAAAHLPLIQKLAGLAAIYRLIPCWEACRFRRGGRQCLRRGGGRAAQALEAFDTLTATVDEYHTTLAAGPAAGAPEAAAAPGGAAAGAAPAPALHPPPAGGSSNPFQVC
jgi:hypothetical protein